MYQVIKHVNNELLTFDKKNNRFSLGKSLSSLGIRKLSPQEIYDGLLFQIFKNLIICGDALTANIQT